MNNAVKSVRATAIVPPMAPLERRSSSGTCRFADHASALNPSVSDSASAMTPRSNGMRAYRSDQRGASWTSSSMTYSGVRTATAQLVAPRIITPSMTAWPPM